MAAYLDNCGFLPTGSGTLDWTYSSALASYQSPAAAGAVNGTVYRYYARSDDFTQWEIGYGAYTSGTGTFARTTILYSSSGTSKITFSTTPKVFVVAISIDIPSLTAANTFTGIITATGFFVGATTPAYTLTNAAGSTTYGKLLHDGTDLFIQQSLAGSVFVTINGSSAHRLGAGFFDIYGATSGRTRLQSVAVAGTTDLTLPAVSGTLAILGANTFTGAQSITDATASSSSTTGALKVTGGLGVGDAINAGGLVKGTQLLPTVAPATGWGFDAQNVTVVVAGNGNALLADGSGLIVLTDGTSTGNTGMYLTGGSAAALVSQTGSGTPFVSPTTTPAANKYCVAWDSGTSHYRIYNGNASAITFTVAMLRARPTT